MKDIKIYTHKVNDDEMFLTRISRVSDSFFQAEFRNISDHHFYNDFTPCDNRVNPLFLLECARQVETYLSHVEFNIPLDSEFLLDNLSVVYLPTKREREKRFNADIYTKYPTSTKNRKNEFNVVFRINGKVIGNITLNVRYMTKQCYKRLRGVPEGLNKPKSHLPLTPASVACHSPQNVILAELNEEGPYVKALINVDENNKCLYDHEQDHVTGMNLTEAAKQLCYCYLSLLMNKRNVEFIPVQIGGVFYRYVEKIIPAEIIIKKVTYKNNIYFFEVNVIQNKHVMASVNVKLRGQCEKIKSITHRCVWFE